MRITYIEMKVKNPKNTRREKKIKFLVDSGVIYSCISKDILKNLGIKPHSKREFTLANGKKIEREIGDAIFEYNGRKASSPVIFGEKGDMNLLGVVTLEALGFIINPLNRRLEPLPLTL